jgi:hypothetical protein
VIGAHEEDIKRQISIEILFNEVLLRATKKIMPSSNGSAS